MNRYLGVNPKRRLLTKVFRAEDVRRSPNGAYGGVQGLARCLLYCQGE